jgi:hypothetical protein
MRLLAALGGIAVALGAFLLLLTIYGEFQPLRNPLVDIQNPEITPPRVVLEQATKRETETTKEFVQRLIFGPLPHALSREWPAGKREPDLIKFNGTLPWRENWLLRLGYYFEFVLPHFGYASFLKRYQFMDYKKTLERGIGHCGDLVSIFTGILKDNGMAAGYVSWDGHVSAVYFDDADSKWKVVDPYFAVVTDSSVGEIEENPDLFWSNSPTEWPKSTQRSTNPIFEDGENVVTKGTIRNLFPTKAIVEDVTEVMKYIIPLLMILVGLILIARYLAPKRGATVDFESM